MNELKSDYKIKQSDIDSVIKWCKSDTMEDIEEFSYWANEDLNKGYFIDDDYHGNGNGKEHLCALFACEFNSTRFIKWFEDNDGFSTTDYAVYGACKGGHADLAQKIIKNRDNYEKIENICEYGLKGACDGGHLDLAKLMVSLGLEHSTRQRWKYEAIHIACKNGHKKLAKYVISLLPTKEGKLDLDDVSKLNRILHDVCLCGDIDLANFMMLNGANYYNWGLEGASKGGHLDLAQLMMEKGAFNTKDCISAINDWCSKEPKLQGHLDVIEYLKTFENVELYNRSRAIAEGKPHCKLSECPRIIYRH